METTFTINKEKLEVVTSRIFNATPERLWSAQTDPEQIPKWWGPGAYKTVIEKNDLKIGGGWRYTQTDSDGKVYAFRGEYKEIDEPNRIVRTFEYEPMPGHILIETVALEAQADGTTKMTATAHYDNLNDLEGMVDMGMESGQREGFERLAKLVS